MLDELAQELSKLYQDPESAKRVATEAGIPTSFLDFSGSSIDMWSGIVRQADRRQLLPNLLAIAVREFSANAKLQRIYGTYLYGQQQASDDRRYYSRDNTYSASMPDAATMLHFIRSVEDLEQIVYGSDRLRIPALKDVVSNLEKTIPQIRERLDRIEEKQRIRNVMTWGITAGLMLLAIIVVILISQQGFL